ncbi:hypothetical protein HDF19_00325 [Mucilaginibacter sp. E4BP6]|uniref:hypothetical protein n=1 Tax=Mucilaginibacter sp. E4BP6 TaxID=2723089 RepID=UPI0015CD2B07|nr:hypothetical protein [Mucilaginibacter sp. E4BP6]NYE66982.1 hypothetical protein [Mucilaginibacter sp. E4BP6]
MENLPLYIAATFGITVLLTIWLFSRATHYAKPILIFLSVLTVVQSVLGLSGFYNDPHTMTARFPMLVIPLTIFCIALFLTAKGWAFIDSLDIKILTILHIIRIPVEITLFWLFVHQAIPQAMTFEGRNYDILSGLSAPLVYYFGFVKKQLTKTVLIIWNVACMLLLINVVASAVLSLPARFQNFGFEQPNIAVGYFPFLLLPAILVPLVLFANAAAIRQLIYNKNIILKNSK